MYFAGDFPGIEGGEGAISNNGLMITKARGNMYAFKYTRSIGYYEIQDVVFSGGFENQLAQAVVLEYTKQTLMYWFTLAVVCDCCTVPVDVWGIKVAANNYTVVRIIGC